MPKGKEEKIHPSSVKTTHKKRILQEPIIDESQTEQQDIELELKEDTDTTNSSSLSPSNEDIHGSKRQKIDHDPSSSPEEDDDELNEQFLQAANKFIFSGVPYDYY